MKRALLIAGLVLLVAQLPALARDDVVRQQHRPNELLSSWLVGSVVRGANAEKLGTVRTLILDEESGRITGVVVATGSVLGFGGKEVGLRWEQLKIVGEGRELLVDISAADAEDAPVFDFRERRVRLPESPSTEPVSASEIPGGR